MGTTISDTKEVVKKFAIAVQEQDLNIIAPLLSDNGEYNTYDAELRTLTSDKPTFLNWLTKELSNTSISRIEYDQCLHCKIGNPVVIFNDGQFPLMKMEMFSKSMTGLMLDITGSKIKEIRFCYTFLDRMNKMQVEILSPEIDRLTANGIPLKKAIDIALKRKDYQTEGGTKGSQIPPMIYIPSDL